MLFENPCQKLFVTFVRILWCSCRVSLLPISRQCLIAEFHINASWHDNKFLIDHLNNIRWTWRRKHCLKGCHKEHGTNGRCIQKLKMLHSDANGKISTRLLVYQIGSFHIPRFLEEDENVSLHTNLPIHIIPVQKYWNIMHRILQNVFDHKHIYAYHYRLKYRILSNWECILRNNHTLNSNHPWRYLEIIGTALFVVTTPILWARCNIVINVSCIQ